MPQQICHFSPISPSSSSITFQSCYAFFQGRRNDLWVSGTSSLRVGLLQQKCLKSFSFAYLDMFWAPLIASGAKQNKEVENKQPWHQGSSEMWEVRDCSAGKKTLSLVWTCSVRWSRSFFLYSRVSISDARRVALPTCIKGFKDMQVKSSENYSSQKENRNGQ